MRRALFCMLLVAGVASGASPALSIERHQIDHLACAQIQAILAREGAAILRYRSTRNPTLPVYDRYVASARFCAFGEYAAPASVPSKDRKSCPVRICAEIEFDVIERD